MRTIRASELGAFLYCRRAWWYRGQGIESQNQAELSGGTEFHHRHGRQVLAAGLLRVIGLVLLLAAFGLLAAYLTGLLLR